MKYLWLAAGGVVGVTARYLLASLVNEKTASGFPWGTLAVNLSGMFFAGLGAALSEHWHLAPDLRLFVFIGILGGFTTFSTFGLETLALARTGQYLYAFAYIAASTVAGLALVAAGYALGRISTGS